jgi:transposase-like protein
LSDLTGLGGLMQEFFKNSVETLLKEEMNSHLCYEHSDSENKLTNNSRNGHSKKKLKLIVEK